MAASIELVPFLAAGEDATELDQLQRDHSSFGKRWPMEVGIELIQQNACGRNSA